MSFRNDLGAAHARADALEKKVAELEAENEALREPPSQGPQRAKSSTLLGAVIVAATLVLFGAVGIFALLIGEPAIAVVAGVLAVFTVVAAMMVVSLVEVVPPGFALVISGRPHVSSDGTRRGYRIITNASGTARAMRAPIIEVAELMDLRPRRVEGTCNRVFLKGNTPATVEFTATVAISVVESDLHNAVERLLGRGTDEVERVARETLEGHIRSVSVSLELAEIRANPAAFVEEIDRSASDDLAKLGLTAKVVTAEVIDRAR